MTNAELIAALRCEKDCGDCAYHTDNLWSRCDEWGMRCDAADALEAAEHRIEDLEGALAACRMRKDGRIPKEGEWIEVHDWLQIPQEERGTYRCSACGQVMKYPWNYCPNCGARMKTVTDCHTSEEGER